MKAASELASHRYEFSLAFRRAAAAEADRQHPAGFKQTQPEIG
jgi:hypothetical protein